MKADLMLHILHGLRRAGPRRAIASGMMALLLAQSASAAAPAPSWWTTQGVLNADAAKDDYTLANVGQLKSVAKKAAAQMRATLGTEGTAIAAMISQWDAALTDGVTGADYTVLNVGMLKNVSSMFYDQLRAHHNDPASQPYAYPWPVVKKAGAATTSGSATVTLPTTSGLAIGMLARGPGIPAGTTITSFISGGTQLVLSANATATATGQTCLFNQPGAGVDVTGGTTVAGADTLALASTTTLRPGMTAFGPGLPGGTRILSIPDSTHLILSQPADASGSGQTFFFHMADDYALVNLGQLKNVFSFAMASFVGDPPVNELPGATLSTVQALWDSLSVRAFHASRDYDADGDGISNLQEYLMNLDRAAPLALLYANDLDGDLIPNAVEDLWNGDGTPSGDVAPLLLDKLEFSDAVKDADGDGVMNFEEVALGLNLRSTTTTPRADGLSDNQVLAWSLLHRTVSLPQDPTTTPPAPGSDAVQACWDQIILTPSLLAKYGQGSHTNWLVETDGPDSNSTPDGLDDFRAEAPAAFASFLSKVSTTASTDHDGDGMPDVWEYRYGLNLRLNDAALDPDGDGMTNLEEYGKNTNPMLKDSDGDGYDDYAEVTYGQLSSSALFANEKPPVRLTLISNSSQNVFLGMKSDALTVRVHKGGIPKAGVNVTFQITDNSPSRGIVYSGLGAVSGIGSVIVPTDSNGMAVAYFVGTRTGTAPIKASMDSSNFQNMYVTVDALSSLLTNTSGNHVNDGGDDGDKFSELRNQAEQDSVFPTSGPGPDGLDLQMQIGTSTKGEYKKQKKSSFYGGAMVAMDQYSSYWQYRQHSIITLEDSANSSPSGGGVSATRTYVATKVTGKEYWKYALGSEGDYKIEVLGSVTFNPAGDEKVAINTSVDWIKRKGGNAIEITPPEAEDTEGKADYYVVFTRVDIVPAADMSGVIGGVVKSAKAGSAIKHFVTPKQTTELDQPDVILQASGISAAQITDGNKFQIVEWDGGQAVPGQPLKRKVSRGDSGPPADVKIVPKGKAAAVQMKVWVVWDKIRREGYYPFKADIVQQGAAGWVTTIHGGLQFSHTIQPKEIIEDPEHPNLEGAKTKNPPGGKHPLFGTDLGEGANNKWDASRRFRFKFANPNNLPAQVFGQPAPLVTVPNFPLDPVEGNDDDNTGDETSPASERANTPVANNPYHSLSGGTLWSSDAPSFTISQGSVGDKYEFHLQLQEFLRLEINGKWYRTSDYQPWRMRVFVKRYPSGIWGVDNFDGSAVIKQDDKDF